MSYAEIRKVNVNDHVESKDGLSYLSWAWAWDTFKQHYPEATYTVVKDSNGLPYFESHAGAIVYTTVTVGELKHEMWLPVMDSKNKAMKREPYTYETRKGAMRVEAFTMFDVNKAIMRCLVKNLAMFGLAIYIYAGEDLPDDPAEDERIAKIREAIKAIKLDNLISRQHDAWVAMKPLFNNNEEEQAAWHQLDSTTRRQIKEHGQALREEPKQPEASLTELIAA